MRRRVVIDEDDVGDDLDACVRAALAKMRLEDKARIEAFDASKWTNESLDEHLRWMGGGGDG